MKLTHLPDQGYMAAGHGVDPEELHAQAAADHLLAGRQWPAGWSVTRAITEAWWGGDEIGFCQAHHDGARPVTVIHVAGA